MHRDRANVVIQGEPQLLFGLDETVTSMQFTFQGSTELLISVGAEENCGEILNAWYYVYGNGPAEDPTEIKLCPSTCSRILSKLGGTIDFVFGCATIVQ